MKVELLVSDGQRFFKGEIGIVFENDSEKYDYYVELPGFAKLPEFLGGTEVPRRLYFFKDEVRVIK